jgi:hypothetical protein
MDHTSQTSGSKSSGKSKSGRKKHGARAENLNSAPKRAADVLVNMFGKTGKHIETRAHQVPASPACHVFWGMVAEAVSGIDMDGFTAEKKLFVRREMAENVSKFKMSLFAFAQPHNSFYDFLRDDHCVMIVPLLTLEEIAERNQGEGYEVLVFCSSEETHTMLGTWRRKDNFDHIKWEDVGDLRKANKVLTAYIKGLGDCLNQHWDTYFDQVESDHTEFKTKKKLMEEIKKILKGDSGKVEIPKTKSTPLSLLKKLFKIDLGELYSKEELGNKEACKPFIPDPSLFSFKAAVNWSGRKPELREKKLLSCCSPEEESDDESSLLEEVPSAAAKAFWDKHVDEEQKEQAGIEYGKKLTADLLGREVAIVSDSEDEDCVSDVSSAGGIGYRDLDWEGAGGDLASDGQLP